MTRTLYNPLTGSSCSHVEFQELNHHNTTTKTEVCIVDNSYNIIGPLSVLFGIMILNRYLADPNQKQGPVVKFVAYSYLAYEGLYPIFIPKTEALPDHDTVLTYTGIFETTMSKNAENNFTSINKTFSAFSQHCEEDYDFSPYTPPALLCFEMHTQHVTGETGEIYPQDTLN